MLFNSFAFALFLPAVFILYWFVANRNLQVQNSLLLVASYFFYACWDWRFMFLLMFSTLLDYYTGIKMQEAKTPFLKKWWFLLSVIVNLGFLGIFKYYNFFAESFCELLMALGYNTIDVHTATIANIILPVGISFYTFHGLSYVIDIYKSRISAERNFVDYAVFVSFFPLLVAGPIERATHLLPQIKQKRTFNYENSVNGLRQILWGLFKKIVIADNCAEYANLIFSNPAGYSGSELFLGALFFTFQIYGDFSGYSDIAIGTGRLFGISLLRNFAFPYFARDIAEFWRRWHISLTTWFRDYVYIPLGGSRCGKMRQVGNTFIIFLLSGFWHGANWTFIAWGALHATFFLPLMLSNKNRKNMDIVARGKLLPTISEFGRMGITFVLVVFAWIFFRANTLSEALVYLSGIFSQSFFTVPGIMPVSLFVLITLFMTVEWLGRERQFALESLGADWNRAARWCVYFAFILLIAIFRGQSQEFIYFQF
ncbi:MAG: MBOAT family protein [Bacteroidales bacterium]|jgi:D-alanyl-lipoteichoic acid acyltransferase DltB (MBOAT superfamily)|nr:MBOAT family protein [Bacteroidales bacterium]